MTDQPQFKHGIGDTLWHDAFGSATTATVQAIRVREGNPEYMLTSGNHWLPESDLHYTWQAMETARERTSKTE